MCVLDSPNASCAAQLRRAGALAVAKAVAAAKGLQLLALDEA